MFQIAQIQTELYFVLCCITIFYAQQRIQQRIMGVDYRRSAGAVLLTAALFDPHHQQKTPSLAAGENLKPSTASAPVLLPIR